MFARIYNLFINTFIAKSYVEPSKPENIKVVIEGIDVYFCDDTSSYKEVITSIDKASTFNVYVYEDDILKQEYNCASLDEAEKAWMYI